MPFRALTPSLRAVRRAAARVCGGLIAAAPWLEPSFIAVGRRIGRRLRVVGMLYWFTQDDLLRRLGGSPHRFRRLPVGGITMAVDITSGTGRLHYFHDEPYEPELAAAVVSTLRPGDVFLDIGANIGFFTTLAGLVVGEHGHVVAIEPHPEAVAALREALASNGLGRSIEIVEAAADATDGRTRLFLTFDPVLSTTDPESSPLSGQYPFDRSIEVRTITVDGWMAMHRDLLARLRAIKIDVEGTEANVLAGMGETVAAAPHAVIFCETTAGSVADTWLQARGYAATYLDARREAFGNYRYARTQAPTPS